MHRCSLYRKAIKEFFHTLKPGRSFGGVFAFFEAFLELTQQILLFGIQVHRRLKNNPAQEVAGPTAAHTGHTLAPQAKDPIGLGFGGNLQFHPTIQRRHLNFSTQNGIHNTDRHFAIQVSTLALE